MRPHESEIEFLKKMIFFKCGTPLMQESARIRKEGREKGLSEDEIRRLCKKSRDEQMYRFHRRDCISLLMVDLFDYDVDGSLNFNDAEKIATDKYDDYEKSIGKFGRSTIIPEDEKFEWKLFRRDRKWNERKGILITSRELLEKLLNTL